MTSGYITPGESAEECAGREVKEELGIELETMTYEGSMWFERGDMLMHGYVGFVHECDFIPSEEIRSARWVRYDEAPKTMYPDGDGNTMWMLYRRFLELRGFTT